MAPEPVRSPRRRASPSRCSITISGARKRCGVWSGEQITADFMEFMADAVDLALPPGDGVTAMLRAYLAFWKARPLSFRFNLWRRLDGLQDERVSRSEQMTRPGRRLHATRPRRWLYPQ